MEQEKEVLSFLPAFTEKYRKAEAKQGYHINVLDETRPDENAHSRILAKLLQQKTAEGKYEILESFIRYISEKCDTFGGISIKEPEITQERERIDLWIRDEDYAVVVENKIHWALDQSEQLARYIDRTREKGYKDDRIYVVYLSPTYDKQPEEQTWGGYREAYRNRFVNLSFADDIARWLSDAVLPNVRLRDKCLSSALEQYIDHLEGKYNLRTINNKMNMELRELIKQEWGLNETPMKNFAKLSAKQEEINRINNQIELLKKEFEQEIFSELQSSLHALYPDYPQTVMENGAGLIVQVKGTTVRVVSSIDSGELYCQVDMDCLEKEKRNMPQEIQESVKHLLPEKNDNAQLYKYLPRYAYEDMYRLQCEVITVLIQLK